MKQHILVTGCAGFIGSHVCERLVAEGFRVTGIDNFDPFYDRQLKEANLKGLHHHPHFKFFEADILQIQQLDLPSDIAAVIHLAAKSGVRPSLHQPLAYAKVNIEGTQCVLDCMKRLEINKLIYASSSSVYGNQLKTPFSETDAVDQPISPYAFTKKSAELLNHVYHYLYGISVLNLRFFTVFGPRQRPDLAIRKFSEQIMKNEAVTVFGDGSTGRDYTYIGDIVAGIMQSLNYLLTQPPVYEIINLGNSAPTQLNDLIATLHRVLNKPLQTSHLPMQEGDVNLTFADIEKAKKMLGYAPKTSLEEGLKAFVKWQWEGE